MTKLDDAMKRLFAAITPPEDICDQLLDLQTGLPGAAWRPYENFHITLQFYGDVDGAVMRDLEGELARIDFRSFEIALSGVGSFGGNDPNSVWAGLAPSPLLQELARACDTAGRKAGAPRDGRKFKAHLTLAYCRNTFANDVAAYSKRFAMFETRPFWVEGFSLFSSRPSKHANHYIEEAYFPANNATPLI